MKKHFSFGLTLLLVGCLLLAGCGRQEPAAPSVASAFSCRVAVNYRELALQGELCRLPENKLQLTFDQPKSLSGVTIGWDGKDMTMELAGISVSVAPDKVPESALIKSLLGVLTATPDNGMLTEEGYVTEGQVDGLAYTLVCDSETGIPTALSVPENELSVVFSQMEATTDQ